MKAVSALAAGVLICLSTLVVPSSLWGQDPKLSRPPSDPSGPYAARPASMDRHRSGDVASHRERTLRDAGRFPAEPLEACLGPCYELEWEELAPVIDVTFSGLAGVEGGHAGFLMAPDGSEKVYVSHGHTLGDVTNLRVYDVATDTWELGPAGVDPRSEGVGAVVGRRLYSIGGRTSPFEATLEIFDVDTQRWSYGTPMPSPRGGTGAAVVDGKIHVLGGRLCGGPHCGGSMFDTHEVYDPATDSWDTMAPMLEGLGDIYAAVSIDRKIYIFGGWDGASVSDLTQIYDVDTDTWTYGTPMPTPRSNAIAGVFAGAAVVIGGIDNALFNLDTVEVFAPEDGIWCDGPVKITPSSEISAAAPQTQDAIYAAGSGSFGLSAQTHEVLRLLVSGGPPVLDCPDNLTLECPADQVDIDDWLASATATDGCTGDPIDVDVELVDHEPLCGETYVDTYVFTATGANGQEVSCTRTLTLVDTQPPVLSGVPADVTVECDNVPPPAEPTAEDACDPDPVIDFDETRAAGSCDDDYVLLRTWTATDACGNGVSESQSVTVVDTTPPVIAGVPPHETVECDALPSPPAGVTATDNCDPDPLLEFSETRVDGDCEDSYVLLRSWTATDRCGNSASLTQVVTVDDTIPPLPEALLMPLEPLPPSSPLSPPSVCSLPASRAFEVVCAATDNCDPAPVVEALLRVSWHEVVDGECVAMEQEILVDCGEEVEIHLAAPPCPPASPTSPHDPLSGQSDGVKVVTGEQVVLELTATDRCGNSATDTYDPALEPSPLCEVVLPDGTCCPAIGPPEPPDCDEPLCGEGSLSLLRPRPGPLRR